MVKQLEDRVRYLVELLDPLVHTDAVHMPWDIHHETQGLGRRVANDERTVYSKNCRDTSELKDSF